MNKGVPGGREQSRIYAFTVRCWMSSLIRRTSRSVKHRSCGLCAEPATTDLAERQSCCTSAGDLIHNAQNLATMLASDVIKFVRAVLELVQSHLVSVDRANSLL